jgi:signal recognition particle subunit SRP19
MVENVIWPAYLDADLSRAEGRRVPQDVAIEDPTAEEIAKAVGQVGYDATIEHDKAYSREPHVERGRVLVKDAPDAKTDVLAAVAAYVGALRE